MVPSCGGDGDGEIAAKQIQSPPFHSMGPSCGGGGEVATKRARLSSDASAGAGNEEDRLSALPDDILVLILRRMGTRDAARTSLLSRRWRRVWALLPWLVLDSHDALDPRQMGVVLEAHEAAVLRLSVYTDDAGPDSVAAWIPVAARRVSGRLYYYNFREEGHEEEAFELPCLERATAVSLHLGFLRLAVSPAGVFSRLTEFSLYEARLHVAELLGNAVSWPRCPCLRKLTICDVSGLDKLTIHSNSLCQVKLTHVEGLQQLNVVAPALKKLNVECCFLDNGSQPVASITAPQLATLTWMDSYDPSSTHLGELRHLRLLKPISFVVYWDEDDFSTYNQSCLSLLQRFKVIRCLVLKLECLSDIDGYDYVMEDMTMLPNITILHLDVLANRHAFGASAFHVLRMCCSIKRLILSFLPPDTEVEAQTTCPPGCICGEHQNWKTEHLLLNRLKEVKVTQMRGSEHEVTFVKQLFNWATSLEKMRVVFDVSITESVAKELSHVLKSFAKPGIRMQTCGFMEDNMLKLYSRNKGASS